MTKFDEFGLPMPKQIPPMPKTKSSETKMNERIRELMNQAMDSTGVEGLGGSYMELNPEKYAELIVRECAKLADKESSYPYSSYGLLIREQFGVKE